MARQTLDWDAMFHALEVFKDEYGHCHVPTHWEKNPQMGRWVAVQRYRRKIGELQEHYVIRLDRIGFVWTPADKVWNEMIVRLVKYKGKHGNCEVPTDCPADPQLARWVVVQRHARKIGSLSEGRVQRLSELGFIWSVYGQEEKTANAEPETNSMSDKALGFDSEEHLYRVTGEYVQYNGTGPRPEKLEKYIHLNGGELPPCIFLPRSPLVFQIGISDSDRMFVRKIKWPGKGPIPEEVLESLNENGALPPHFDLHLHAHHAHVCRV